MSYYDIDWAQLGIFAIFAMYAVILLVGVIAGIVEDRQAARRFPQRYRTPAARNASSMSA